MNCKQRARWAASLVQSSGRRLLSWAAVMFGPCSASIGCGVFARRCCRGTTEVFRSNQTVGIFVLLYLIDNDIKPQLSPRVRLGFTHIYWCIIMWSRSCCLQCFGFVGSDGTKDLVDLKREAQRPDIQGHGLTSGGVSSGYC